MKSVRKILFVLVVTCWLAPFSHASDPDPVIQNVVDHLKQDLAVMNDYGAHQRIVTTRLTEHGKPNRVEEKDLRTVWVQDKARNELVNVRCSEYDESGRTKRCADIYRIKYPKKDSKPGRIESEIKKVQWTDLHKNFVFAMLPAEGPYHVISFRPRKGISTNNRIEKLLSQMAGKVWIDRQFNVIKAEAKLVDPVSFGLGVAAKVHHLAIRYTQQPFRATWLPSSLTVDFKAKVALVHNERQRIEVFLTGPYRRSDAIWAQAQPVKGNTTRR